MDNINSLRNTGRPTQDTITLSSIKMENDQYQASTANNTVNIDITNGKASGVAETDEARQVVRVNPNMQVKRRTRSVNSADELNIVNPNDYFEKPSAPAPKSMLDRTRDFDALEAAINRKQQEYIDFVNSAIEADHINRENIEAGLDTVDEEEVTYLPKNVDDDYNKEIKDDIIIDNPSSFTNTQDDYDELEDFYNDEDGEEDNDISTMRRRNVDIFDPLPSDNVNNFDEKQPFSPFENIVYEDINEDEIKDTEDNIPEEEPFDPVETSVNDFEIEEPIIEENVTQDSDDEEELNITKVYIDEDSSDTESDPDDDISDEQEQKNLDDGMNNLKAEIVKKIIKADKRVNTSGFKVSGKSVEVKDIIRSMGSKPIRNISWPLTYAERPFIASPLSGAELSLIADADDSNNENSVGITKTQARIMYEHDMNEFRPSTFEAWAKTIPHVDINNIFLALYVASLGGSNYLPYVCPKKCSYSFLSDNIDINSMVKFESDKAEKIFNHIKNNVSLNKDNSTSYNSVFGIISDTIAVSIKVPSIYNMVFELRELDQDFKEKYSNAINIVTYIDNLYYINNATQTYDPITWKKYLGDPSKSFKSKIIAYSKIIKQFDDSEYGSLTGLINAAITKLTNDRAVYCEIPETKCLKCGATIPASQMNNRDLVFLRQRLVALATSPTER